MSTGWVAATVRARAMARRRVGSGLARRIAEAPTLDAGHGSWPAPPSSHQRAGTSPRGRARNPGRGAVEPSSRRMDARRRHAAGPVLARRFEQANIERHREQLSVAPPPVRELGSLATSWPRLAATMSLEDLS